MKGKSRIAISGIVQIEHRRADGTLVSKQRVENRVVNIGLDWLKALMAAAGSGQSLYIGLSSAVGEPAAGDTDLGATVYTAYGLERALGAYAAGGTGVFTVTKTFTCTADTKVVASLGLYWTVATGSTLFAGVACTSTTLMNTDTLAVTWTITLTSV